MATPGEALHTHRNRSVRILAKSIVRELTAQGYNEKQIVSLATELLAEVTSKMSGAQVRS